MTPSHRPPELLLVHPPEMWPGGPAARRRLWVDCLLAATLEAAGECSIRRVDLAAAGAAGQAGADRVVVPVHGDLPEPPQQLLAKLAGEVGSSRLALYGDLTAEGPPFGWLGDAAVGLVLRGLPSPLWLAELGAGPGGEHGPRVHPPLIPAWSTLPATSFRDPANPDGVLVRASLGVAEADAGCGLTAFEGPCRRVGPDVVVADLERLAGGGRVHAEVVDAGLRLDLEDEAARWLEILERSAPVGSWSLPISALGDEARRRLREVGVAEVRTRLVSASGAVGRALHDRSDPASVVAVLAWARASGAATELVLEVGAPGEGPGDRARTAAWLEANAALIDSLVLRLFTPAPGSELGREPSRHGIWWVPGGSRADWADRRGSNPSSRHKLLSELAVFARDLGIECRTPGVTLAADVVRRRDAVVRRYRAAAEGGGGVATPAAAPPTDAVPPPSGPRVVEIELSAACNLRCAGCWCHSELLGEERHAELQQARPLPTARIVALLDELSGLGVREVQLSGSGEPLMNRDTVAIVAHAAQLGFETNLVTNGVLLDAVVADRLAQAGLDQVTVSLWAGDPDTYRRTHPGTAADAFSRLTEGLQAVAAARSCHGRPRIKVYHVISRLNCGAIEAMLEHALDIDADVLELQVVDLLAATESELALAPRHVAEIEAALARLQERPDFTRIWMGRLPLRPDAPAVVHHEVADFGRFLRLGPRAELFTPLADSRLQCRKGLVSDGAEAATSPLVEFSFPVAACRECELRSSCFGGGRLGQVVAPTLEWLGAGSFLRRTRAAVDGTGLTEAAIVRNLPCVVGDVYSRVDYRGNIVACCKGSSMPLGNIVGESFATVWHGPRYVEFRRHARTLPKDHPYFAPFDCLRSCDNLGMNLRALYASDALPQEPEGRR